MIASRPVVNSDAFKLFQCSFSLESTVGTSNPTLSNQSSALPALDTITTGLLVWSTRINPDDDSRSWSNGTVQIDCP